MPDVERVRIEIPTESINGVNKDFTTSVEFVPGSLTVHYNGQTLTSPCDIAITGPTSFRFVHFAPKPPPNNVTQVQFHYLETLAPIVCGSPRVRCL